jgi:hypothetical protein
MHLHPPSIVAIFEGHADATPELCRSLYSPYPNQDHHWTHLHFPSIVLDPRCPRALSSTRKHPTVLEEEGQKVNFAQMYTEKS